MRRNKRVGSPLQAGNGCLALAIVCWLAVASNTPAFADPPQAQYASAKEKLLGDLRLAPDLRLQMVRRRRDQPSETAQMSQRNLPKDSDPVLTYDYSLELRDNRGKVIVLHSETDDQITDKEGRVLGSGGFGFAAASLLPPSEPGKQPRILVISVSGNVAAYVYGPDEAKGYAIQQAVQLEMLPQSASGWFDSCELKADSDTGMLRLTVAHSLGQSTKLKPKTYYQGTITPTGITWNLIPNEYAKSVARIQELKLREPEQKPSN